MINPLGVPCVTDAQRQQSVPKQQPGSVSRETSPVHYALCCPACGAVFEDDGRTLECRCCVGPSLLVAQYTDKEFRPFAEERGLYRYRNWLPVRRVLRGSGGTVTYRSEGLCTLTGLNNLWIAFNGCWPERDAHLLSGTFKELEACCVLGRLPEASEDTMVIASAGNTAAAFARICSLNSVRCLIIVPESGLRHMRFEEPIAACVKVVAVTGTGDYTDAIRLGNHVAQLPGFFAEGGAKNVARRDGLGSVLLSAFEAIGSLPDYYFQAIGSGTGAIAVHENARRLGAGPGRFPRLWLSQNLPFAPIYNAWKSGSKEWPRQSESDAKVQIGQIRAQVLANRVPPYAIRGGLYEALMESEGMVDAVTNEEGLRAGELFEQQEGIDIDPAAAVAFASLLKAVEAGRISRQSTVVLNVTGGGQRRRFRNVEPIQVQADLLIDAVEVDSERSLERIVCMCDIGSNIVHRSEGEEREMAQRNV
jgi:cysteate synthase